MGQKLQKKTKTLSLSQGIIQLKKMKNNKNTCSYFQDE